jgi:hypothetical protein
MKDLRASIGILSTAALDTDSAICAWFGPQAGQLHSPPVSTVTVMLPGDGPLQIFLIVWLGVPRARTARTQVGAS